MSAIADPIVARIDALERAIASLQVQQSTGEALQATFTTLSPSGVVGAVFPGGIQMNEQPDTSLNQNTAIEWLDSAGGGQVREFIQGAFLTPNHFLVTASLADLTDGAHITAQSQAGGGAGTASVSAAAFDHAGGVANPTIIDSSGNSSFLQLLSTQQLALSVGSGSFNGNGTNSVAVTFNHSFGRSPTFAWVMPQGAPFIAWGFTFSPTQVSFTASDPFGVFANGTPYNLSIAILG